VAPLLIAPWSGRLADRIGARPLVVSGLLLQAAGFAWIATAASPQVAYPGLLAPMIISGAGIALALPALTKAGPGRLRGGTGARPAPRQGQPLRHRLVRTRSVAASPAPRSPSTAASPPERAGSRPARACHRLIPPMFTGRGGGNVKVLLRTPAAVPAE
jgi:hypothetical protein